PKGAPVRGRRGTRAASDRGGASIAADRDSQLALFGSDPQAVELRSLLEELDLERLSPREALAILFEWKERLTAAGAQRRS
ncbi:MAG: hypothetical protein ACREOU_05035, partial [Candidatus Eiseniibacteriota bacterium]